MYSSHVPRKLAWHVHVEIAYKLNLHFFLSLHFLICFVGLPTHEPWEICRIQHDILRTLTTWLRRKKKFKANVSEVTPNQRSISSEDNSQLEISTWVSIKIGFYPKYFERTDQLCQRTYRCSLKHTEISLHFSTSLNPFFTLYLLKWNSWCSIC